ncbi:lipase, putative [Bodo saltans]|uniref:Lipase, putative n=1 Tax=Bodo saltans TaxID=75058 RepID=A0A0S4JFF1_BODSA|nr:lipase, putative [Bodo saltans]|eukprot:CUG88782.1 lipase, putative [Bodo saltans]
MNSPITAAVVLLGIIAVNTAALQTTNHQVQQHPPSVGDQQAAGSEGSNSYGWFHPTDLIWNTSSEFYFHEIGVFMNATRLSYVSTYGGYYENWTVNESISDLWVRSEEYFLNPQYGMRALVFYQPDTARLLIAYRGTDLTNDIGGLCDRCADTYLWDNVPYQQLPADCMQFPETTLDYLTLAANFANDVAFAFAEYEIMFTGHSLGAGLAAVVSTLGNAALNFGCAPANSGAVVFSAPGYIATMMYRTSVDLSVVDPYRVVTLVDRWDPVWVGCNASTRGGVMAQVCQWFFGVPSTACIECDSTPAELPLNTSNCETCMMQRHAFFHYEQLRPISPACAPSGRQECSWHSCWSSGSMCSLSGSRSENSSASSLRR